MPGLSACRARPHRPARPPSVDTAGRARAGPGAGGQWPGDADGAGLRPPRAGPGTLGLGEPVGVGLDDGLAEWLALGNVVDGLGVVGAECEAFGPWPGDECRWCEPDPEFTMFPSEVPLACRFWTMASTGLPTASSNTVMAAIATAKTASAAPAIVRQLGRAPWPRRAERP